MMELLVPPALFPLRPKKLLLPPELLPLRPRKLLLFPELDEPEEPLPKKLLDRERLPLREEDPVEEPREVFSEGEDLGSPDKKVLPRVVL